MSRRQLLNISLGTSAILFVAALVAALSNWGAPGGSTTQIDLAKQQVQEVDALSRTLGRLESADDFEAVRAERQALAEAVLRFDSNLAALLGGGAATTAAGAHLEVEPVRDRDARQSLQEGADLWREVGLPLADLAAGEYSIFSAAGQQAVQGLRHGGPDLVQTMETAAQSLGQAAHAGSSQARTLQLLAFLFGGLTLALGAVRFRPRPAAETAPPPRHAQQPAAAPAATPNEPLPADAQPIAPASARPGAATAAAGGFEAYRSPVDFDSVNASVDQLSVDMNTIAGSTEKMRLAIESVGHALQGMLFSLNEMAQDTAEGHKVVRGANNAASYTATAAEELTASAREMAQVVSRVTQLALKTKQVAAQIDAEAIATGKTGEAFTSVVASEVKGLAAQTSHATHEIESTVAEIMATARQYEEAIGQIIKHISGINKVAQNLGELMLHPPQRVVPGTPLTPAPAPAAPQVAAPAPEAAQPTAPAEAPAAEAPPAPAEPAIPTADQAKPDEPAFHPAEAKAEPAEVDPWGGIMDDPAPAEKNAEEVAADTSAAIEEAAAPEPESEPAADTEPSGSNGNVFMLGGPKKKVAPKKETAPEAAAEPAPEPAPKPGDAAEAEAAPGDETLKDGWGAAAAPAAEAPAAEAEEEEEEETGSNIFMLQRPKKKKAGPAAETAGTADETTVEKVPAGAPADEAEAEEKPSGNIFMLNKKK